MDRDTKIRRLSPVAVLANPGTNGYIDLVNGPQDFSCCQGYTCAERLSTFFTMVATGIDYEIMFTSVPPQNMRLHLLHNNGGEAVRLKIFYQQQQRRDIYVNGLFINPNNIDFAKEDYALKPPGDEYIPGFGEGNGANYYDPNSGYLYILLRGDDTVDIKTQPVVILKVGTTVDIDNFFEENVVENLAGLLGIDPSNIRVANIVREGSVRRRKRSTETQATITFEIGPPPAEELGDEFIPEEWTYTTAAGPVTVNPIYSTPPPTARPTTPWVTPFPDYLTFDSLQPLQVILANEFQAGNLSSAMNLTLTGFTMVEPIPEPMAPPPYTSPEERGQVTELTWAEQSALNNTALVELISEQEYAVPDSLRLVRQPQNVREMQIIDPPLSLYLASETGAVVSNLGDDSDPWNCTVTVTNGTGSLSGEVTVPFLDGFADFTDLRIDAAGEYYELTFTVSSPDNSLDSLSTQPFTVEIRPLSLKVLEVAKMVPENAVFSIEPTIWDEALDAAASSDVVSGIQWDCSVQLVGNGNAGVLSGTMSKSGLSGAIVFDDLTIDAAGLDYTIETTCQSADYGNNQLLLTESPPFNVHTWPEVGMLKESLLDFEYVGPYAQVESVISAFTNSVVECNNCKKIDVSKLENVVYPF